jgi:ATP-dependent RNA helicase DDX24/MAK5
LVFGAGFLELEEIDGADYGIFGTIVEDVGASARKVGNDQKKKKTKRGKRKRGDNAKRLDADVGGDDDADCADGLVVESKEEEGEKAEEKGKRKKRNSSNPRPLS